MSQVPLCPTCGRPLPEDAPRGLCPKCLLDGALAGGSTLESQEEFREETGPHALDCQAAPIPSTDGDEHEPSVDIKPEAPHALPPGTRSADGGTLIGPLDPDFPEPLAEVTDAPTIPGYAIRAVLGSGGMGIVYKAVQRQLKRTVALKMIRGDLSVEPDQLVRFRLEAEAIARLRHPNVVQIYEVGEVGGLPYFSLEMLEGGTLADKLAGAPMTARPAAELTAKLARAVDAVHAVGFIHRDLKPANVLFELDGTPKISDFGLARRLEVADGQTVSGQIMGTPSYMAPEQAEGHVHQIGAPADIYALGAVLYEVLTGRPPFKGPNMLETLRQVVFEDLVPPSRLQSRVPRDLETICLKCLEKERTRRYATAGELADDLGRFLDGKAILARPTPTWERALKWVRRRPATAAMIGFGLATAIGLGVAAERYSAYRRSTVANLGLDAVDGLDRAMKVRTSVDPDRLSNAKVILSTLLTKLRPEPGLDQYVRRAEAELSDVDVEISGVKDRAAVRERFARFYRLRDRALLLDGNAVIFPETLVHAGEQSATADDTARGPRREGPSEKIRATARAALEVYPLGAVAAPLSLPAALTAGERAEVEADRYLLLMALSEAVARPVPGEDPKQQAGEALELLDRAAALHAPTSTFHLRRAACLARLGDAAAAQHEAGQAERIAPTDAFDHLLLGREELRRGALDGARSHLDAALRLRPDSFWARCLLAIAELNSTPPRAAEAKTELTTCLRDQPSYSWLYLLRGTAYGQMGAALAAVGRAPAPRAAALAAEGEARFEDAEADFRNAIKLGLEKPLDYVLAMNRGVMRFQRGKWESAVADFEQAIALDPARYNGYVSLGQALRKLGRRDEAIARLGEAIAREPKLAALPRARALARLDGVRGDLPPDEAEAEAVLRDLETAAQLEPPGSRAAAEDHTRRGRLLLARRRPDEALTAADAAMAVDPGAMAAHLVKLTALLVLERPGDVIDSCDAALAKGTGSAELYRLRGMARLGRNDFSGAIEDDTMALALHPDEPAEVLRDRGWAHLFAGAPEMALHDFEAALRLDSAAAEGYAGRAAARVRLNRIRDALADAEESLRRTEPEPSPRLLYIAAQTYTQASVRAVAAVARSGRPATDESLAYESRAADLLEQALERTPAPRRPAFWRDVIARDALLRPLWQNPRILRRFQLPPGDGPDPLSRRADEQQHRESVPKVLIVPNGMETMDGFVTVGIRNGL